ncbi:MAG TPA: hypothetical protein VNK48_09545 [Xanthobacteraceae bacterium]|nr:hypothetical protein [Xanthobacteraceae bacterium]
MPSAPESGPPGRMRRRALAVLALNLLGFALTILVFCPGIMTLDARYMYTDIGKKFLGDWQSPAMTVLWALIDPLAPGPASMFSLTAALYWLAFTLIGLTLARYSAVALALPFLALSPPAFLLVGIIWRDVLFAAVWLLAAALVFDLDTRKLVARTVQGLAIALIMFGVLLRPNAAPAAPLLAAYVLWPAHWSLKRALLSYLPALVVFVALVPLVYYVLLGATRQHPLHGLFVFDLGGISHFAGENQFPLQWTAREHELLVSGCYQPDKWDIYWYIEPCRFVMQRLEGEKIFGTPAMLAAWGRAVLKHPGAYARHRAAFMTNFLTGTNLVMWTQDVERPEQPAFADRATVQTLLAIEARLRPTWLFKPATWLVLCAALCALAWRRRASPIGAFIIGLCGSAAVYVATYAVVGVASDYRYGYFAALAGIVGSVALVSALAGGRWHAQRGAT